MKKTRLRYRGVNDYSVLKEKIQAKLREIVIKRDKGCILRDYPETGKCDSVLQAEHLLSRAESSTFSDTRNIVCLCRKHHIFWKPTNSLCYWEIVEEMIGVKRWEWLQKMKQYQSRHIAQKHDLKLELLALEMELKRMK